MAFILDGRDNLSTVFRRIGENAEDFHRRINESVDESGGELRAFTRGAGGQLQELGRTMDQAGRSATGLGDDTDSATDGIRSLGTSARDTNTQLERLTRDSGGRLRGLGGRFVSAREASDRFGISVGSLVPSISRLASASGEASAELGTKGGGLSGGLTAVAAIAGLSVLPAIGALVPMLAGMGVAALTMKLGFSGIGAAMEAAGKGKKEYAAALKELTPEAQTFTKELVSTKKEFSGLSDKIQAAMLPGFTQALKESSPIIKIVGDSATEMGRGFGNAAAGVGRLMKDSGFQKDFSTTLRLGRVFVDDLTHGLGGLTRGFLEFGAASEPTLRSLSSGIGNLLGQGLPGMFDGLERGVEGSSKFFDGLFGSINEALPALGRFAGEVARTFGPALGEQLTLTGHIVSRALDMIGYGVRLLKPVLDDLTYGLKAVWLLAQPFATAFKEAGKAIVGALSPAGDSVEKVRGPLQRLHATIQENKLGLMEFARIGGNFMITLAEGVIRYLPDAVGAFRLLAMGALSSLDVIVSGLAMTIGKIPGFGDKFRQANTEFDKFRDGFINGLETAKGKTQDFANATLPRLSQNKLQMNISAWESQIKVAKGQLESVPPEGKSRLTAHIADLERKAAQARAELAAIRDRAVTVSLTYVTRGSMNNTTMRHEGLTKAAGGIIRGPGTSTSDSIPAMLSNGEYVLRAAAVARLGQGTLDALNEGRALPAAEAGGGSAAAAARAAVRAAVPAQQVVNITIEGAIDPVATAQQIQRLLLKVKRAYGGPDLGFA
ncbi:hypothetical protein OG373_06750 [Streptomyces avidinii]|uniref:hypothetical protein n=1 Tax=Streptomyces avidinii TaxID=1895 RepID=UPI00386FEC75|nr:hypothetical protein OG373_06750 [Streptomyces avidinii]